MKRMTPSLPSSLWDDVESPAVGRQFPSLADAPASVPSGEQEAWLISYLDLLTLLLVLFVVLLAFSQLAPASVERPSKRQELADEQQVVAAKSDDPAVAELISKLTIPELGESVQVAVSPGAVNVEIADSVLFVPASAELNPHGRLVLERLAQALARNNLAVSVEGHTDDLPIRNERFPSNWELSSHRATTVTRYLVVRGIAPGRLRAIGYAETRPKANNDTPQGRARNRRVSLVVHLDATRNQHVNGTRPVAVLSG